MEEILNSLIDKKFNYKGKEIVIQRWKKVNSAFVVFSDKQTYNFFESEIELFISELNPIRVKLKEGVLEKRQLEIKNASIQLNNYQHKPMNTENNEVKNVSVQDVDLSTILIDTIKKVQNSKDYINQANAICNVVSQMINVKKLELLIKKQLK
jgi:hypothetical protein